MTGVEVRRAADRAVTTTPWLRSRHSFSYGAHYDPANTHFGLLLACNDDVLAAGTGFEEHPHRDVEVLTWVLSGALRHTDDAGHRGAARPGVVQRMSAGDGVRHTERAGAEPAHYVQMWLRPAQPGGRPGYDTVDLTADLARGRLVTLRPLRQPGATLHAGRLPAGGSVCLPGAPYLHLLVARGSVELAGGGRLDEGDAARLTGTGPIAVRTAGGAEVLAWQMRGGRSVG